MRGHHGRGGERRKNAGSGGLCRGPTFRYS